MSCNLTVYIGRYIQLFDGRSEYPNGTGIKYLVKKCKYFHQARAFSVSRILELKDVVEAMKHMEKSIQDSKSKDHVHEV
eukprot:m.54625 g.54625  ORF g.54625 m.54625 type:complete len:79 (+) comp10937_c0_seq2:2254-2490(+)